MSIFGNIKNALTGTVQYSKPPENSMPATPNSYSVPERGVSFTDQDLSVLKPVLYGEISNRPADKQELEARVIANTAFNRMASYAKNGQSKTLSEVLSMPNQYQAYGGKQYQDYNNPKDATSTQKKQTIDSITSKIIDEIKAGKFQDNTAGAYFYQHNPKGEIHYDNRPLFKSNLGQKQNG